jgi:hypothetical protein
VGIGKASKNGSMAAFCGGTLDRKDSRRMAPHDFLPYSLLSGRWQTAINPDNMTDNGRLVSVVEPTFIKADHPAMFDAIRGETL